jgi:ubiquinone/menaquinone biosynthesis C-methylase UbiE
MPSADAFKDLFSRGATAYARFRPSYPASLFAWLAETSPGRALAVDVGTGNGQAAVALAGHFQRVLGLDPSADQLARAQAHPRVEYRQAPAEALAADDGSADLVTAAQAFHWFAHDRFFAEVERVLRPGGLLAVWCYGLSRITPAVDAVVWELYHDHLDAYWEPERKLVESGYRTVAVPFAAVEAPAFEMRLDWRLEHLAGYLGTWSPLARYRSERGSDPWAAILPRLAEAWGEVESRPVTWPLAVRAFRL